MKLQNYINTELFTYTLRGLFTTWRGTYRLLLNESNTYLSIEQGNSSSQILYRAIRDTAKGLQIQLENDNLIANLARREFARHGKTSFIYNDFLSLPAVAFPILYKENHLATLFLGGLPIRDDMTDNDYEKFLSIIENYNSELKLEHHNIMRVSKKIPFASQETFIELTALTNNIIQNTHQQIQQITRLNELETFQNRTYLRYDRLNQTYKVIQESVSQIDQTLNKRIANPHLELEFLWSQVEQILERMIDLFDARLGLLLSHKMGTLDNYTVVCSVGTKVEKSNYHSSYFLGGNLINEVTKNDKRWFSYSSDLDSLRITLKTYDPHLDERLQECLVVSIRENVSTNASHLLVFGFEARNEILSEQEFISISEIVAAVISTSLGSWNSIRLLEEQQELKSKYLDAQMRFVGKITHQMMNPVNYMLSGSELINARIQVYLKSDIDYFSNWTNQEVEWLQKRLKDIGAASKHMKSIADRLTDVIFNQEEEIEWVILQDVYDLLIEIVRTYQAGAHGREIKVNVDSKTIIPLNRRLRISDKLFREIIGNLVDNAIKYSDDDTTTKITGAIDGDWVYIIIANIGIQLSGSDVKKVFEDEYRTLEAQRMEATGTGLGLPIARRFAKRLNGDLYAEASERHTLGWKTNFILKLPLQPK